jgi:uncharacterized protein
MNILLTGATGLIGTQLGISLVHTGHNITALTRTGKASDLAFPASCISWDHKSDLPPSITDQSFDAVIHLAGETVSQRWTSQARKNILESRVQSTRILVDYANRCKNPPKIWLNASAIGIYKPSTETECSEQSELGQDFLASVCELWEGEVQKLKSSIRKAYLRFGVILSNEGGALPKMIFPFRYGLGGPIGNGSAMMSWIHIHDAVEAIQHVLRTETLEGPINVVAPAPVSNKTFTASVANNFGLPAVFPVPTLLLKLILGDMSSIITTSLNVIPKKLQDSGFTFKFGIISDALTDLLQNNLTSGMRLYVAYQWIDGTPESHFPFFSAAENLEKITPPWLHFKITKKSSETMGSGLLIDYKLRIKGLPVKWRTRIEDWSPPHKFVDTQLKGPYKIWHHTHQFDALGTGTLMTDRVRYKMKVWPFGDVALWMVQNDVRTIFGYRRKFIESYLKSK